MTRAVLRLGGGGAGQQSILDGIEFARGSNDSEWGLLRATLGHPEPFNLRHVAMGNENCEAVGYAGRFQLLSLMLSRTHTPGPHMYR